MATGAGHGAGGGQRDHPGNRREHQRLPFTVSQITVAVMHPGGTLSKFIVACRDLSAGGIAFLHRGFLYTGTQCQIYLPTLTGGGKEVQGKVVRCSHIKSNIHEIGVAFTDRIDPRQFMDVGVEYAELNDKPIELPDLKGRVLFIGTNPLDFSLLTHQLQGTGIELAHCRDPEEAVNEARRSAFDVILCDLLLTDLSGEEVIAALRAAGCRTPIIASTAERDRERLRMVKQVGGNGVLLKPYSPATLIGVLSQHLENRAFLSASQEPIYSSLPRDSSLMPLVADFVRSVKMTAVALRRAAQTSDLKAVRKFCLQLQGNGASYGFKVLTDVAGEAAEVAKESSAVDQVGHSIEKVLSVCARMQANRAA